METIYFVIPLNLLPRVPPPYLDMSEYKKKSSEARKLLREAADQRHDALWIQVRETTINYLNDNNLRNLLGAEAFDRHVDDVVRRTKDKFVQALGETQAQAWRELNEGMSEKMLNKVNVAYNAAKPASRSEDRGS